MASSTLMQPVPRPRPPVVLDYEIRLQEVLVLHHMLRPYDYAATFYAERETIACWAGITLIGGLSAAMAGHVFVVVLLAAVFASYMVRALPSKKRYWAQVAKSYRKQDRQSARLEILGNGLLQTTDAVQMFVPWNSLKTHLVHENILFIEYGRDHWFAIRRETCDPQSGVDVLRSELLAYHVEERPAPPKVVDPEVEM